MKDVERVILRMINKSTWLFSREVIKLYIKKKFSGTTEAK